MSTLFKTIAAIATGVTIGLGGVGVRQAEASTLHSGTTIFDFTGSRSTQDSLNFSEDGIDLEVTAFATSIFGVSERDVAQRNRGLGVKSDDFLGPLDSPQIDGFGPNETLLLTFSPDVSLVAATFSNVQRNDEFSLFVDGDLLVSEDIPNNNTFNFTSLAPNNEGSQFGFSVTDFNDDYFLKSVKVKAIEEPVSTPEPASLLGLLAVGAFGANSAVKRKKAVS